MSTFQDAFTALCAQEYASDLAFSHRHPQFPVGDVNAWTKVKLDPDNEENDDQLLISQRVGQIVVERLGAEFVDFGTFDNCREYGLTYTVAGWQFAVYEHRNSDEICLQGCPLPEVRPYGPYGDHGDANKYDVLAKVSWQHYGAAAEMLIAAIRAVNNYRNAALTTASVTGEPHATASLEHVRAHLTAWN